MTLEDVHPEQQFVTKDGIMLANLFDLSLELADMSDETFIHHVNEDKNDFYSWVHHIVEDPKLAKQLSTTKNKEEMMKTVQIRILELQRGIVEGDKDITARLFGEKHLLAGVFILMVVGLILLRALVF